MAADYGKLMEKLRRFYDFTGKVVLFVGAGGGRLLDPSVKTKRLIAIDNDPAALRELEANLAAKGMQASTEIVWADFEEVRLPGDAVYFEFCLHEMADPMKALTHARALAPNIVVFDHAPGSEWAFHAAEENKVRCSHQAMEAFGSRRHEAFCVEQDFRDHAELLARVSVQGPVAIERARRFADVTNIVIPMSCELVLL